MTDSDQLGAGCVTGGDGRASLAAEVRYQVAIAGSAALLRLTGVLDTASLAAVRDSLLTRLADWPGPVVVDVSRLRVTDPAVPKVFAELHRTVADWPAADLVLCASSDAWRIAGAPFSSSPAVALSALAREPAAVLAADLTPTVGAARQARELVAAGCARHELHELVEPGAIAVTEMVTNVVTHTRTRMTVRVEVRDRTLRVGVRDHSSHLPRLRGPVPPTATGGRGLLLVDTVARRWGSTPLPDGKLVWAVLHADDGTAR